MNKRPLPVLVIGWLFIAVGVVALAYHATEFKPDRPLQPDLLWICTVRLLAIVGGLFLLRGQNWARWLLTAWMAYHIILSAFHSVSELVMHIVLFGLIGYFLLRRGTSNYFRRKP
jgi:hypothetical protein